LRLAGANEDGIRGGHPTNYCSILEWAVAWRAWALALGLLRG
jgi:hypothetical protein